MVQARKTGHLEGDGASKQELHKLADRFHTVLKNPIDTTTLRGDGITAEIHQAAAKITGKDTAADGAAHDTVAPKTPERVSAPKTPLTCWALQFACHVHLCLHV